MKIKGFFRTVAVVLAALTLGVSAFAFTACGGDLKIAIPDDATNQARAIKLLEQAGFIEVDPAAGYSPEMKHITKVLYNVEIVPTQANNLPRTLEEYGAAIINGTFATANGLSPRDKNVALLAESQGESGENPYVNIVVARSSEKDSQVYKDIVEAVRTQEVAEFMLEEYKGAYVPAFAYNEDYTVGSDFINSIKTYQSPNKNNPAATVVKLGVVGSANEYWKAAQKYLDEHGKSIYIKETVFDAYNLPNQALANGDIDLNSFQHKAYLAKEVGASGYEIESIGDTLIAPLTLYSKKANSLDKLKELAGKKA